MVAVSRPDNAAQSEDGLKNIPVEHLRRGQYQPRIDMRQDSLEELAESIKAQGVVQPIVARPISKAGGSQRYEIIAGERRWRAAQMAGLAEIPAVLRRSQQRKFWLFSAGFEPGRSSQDRTSAP